MVNTSNGSWTLATSPALTICLTQTSTCVPRYSFTVWWAIVGHLGQVQMADIPYSEIGITQETREAMYPDNYSDKLGKVYHNLIDEIVRPAHIESIVPDHSILLDELVLMYDAHMTIGGEQNRFNASVIKAAINVIRAL
jgi:hypothetical protein